MIESHCQCVFSHVIVEVRSYSSDKRCSSSAGVRVERKFNSRGEGLIRWYPERRIALHRAWADSTPPPTVSPMDSKERSATSLFPTVGSNACPTASKLGLNPSASK